MSRSDRGDPGPLKKKGGPLAALLGPACPEEFLGLPPQPFPVQVRTISAEALVPSAKIAVPWA